MVKLADSAPIDNEKVQVACVSDEHVKPNSTCWTAGWGEQLAENTELHTLKVNGELSETFHTRMFTFSLSLR